MRAVVPILAFLLALLAWHLYVTLNAVPPYILPGPLRVAEALVADWPTLVPSLLVTLRTTMLALLLALAGGVLIAVAFSELRWLELALSPFAVILQVTPIVAVAPLLLVYAPNTETALLACTFLVTFFPILATMLAGLRSVDHQLLDLMDLYGASRWQRLIRLKLPASLPFFLAGLRTGGGLALVAAVVAEFAAGAAGRNSGLAFRLLESQYRLNIPRLFAALVLLALAGIAIYGLTTLISWLALRRWHDSAVPRDR